MTIAPLKSRKKSIKSGFHLWYERVMVFIILFNVILVIFNLTYIPLRDFWLQGKFQLIFVQLHRPVNFLFFKLDQIEIQFPPKHPIKIIPSKLSRWITNTYDPVKGIAPYRSTQEYLNLVSRLEKEVQGINQEFVQPSLKSPTTSPSFAQQQTELDRLLARLRADSIEIIDTNPFQVAGKTGTLEKIKNEMTTYIFGKQDSNHSPKEALRRFWSKEFLFREGFISYVNDLKFFNQTISPLIQTNYFRPIGENNLPVDNFGAIDFPFGVLFFLEFLGRTWLISRRYTNIKWFDAMLWRWYDIFLFLPFLRWLRIVPLIIRLNQAELISLRPIERQISQGFVATIAGDMTEIVVLRVISQLQEAIKRGFVKDFFRQSSKKSYIDLNNIHELTEIIKLITDLIVHKVLPDIRPEAETFVRYNLNKALTQTPAYNGLQRLPGVKSLETQLTEQLSSQLYATFCKILENVTREDPTFNQLVNKLSESFNRSVGKELKAQDSVDKLEYLLMALLEEIKVNYIQKLSQEEVEELLEETRKLHQTQDQRIDLYSQH